MRFSHRNSYQQQPEEKLAPEDLPTRLREAIAAAAIVCSYNTARTRNLIAKTLLCRPDKSNWSEEFVQEEIHELLSSCEWYLVLDAVEAVYAELIDRSPSSGPLDVMSNITKSMQPGKGIEFRRLVNERLMTSGAVWQLSETGDVIRTNDAPTHDLLSSISEKMKVDNPTALSEIAEALDDLKRKPEPDYSGSVQHSMAALECLAADKFGAPRETQMSQVIKRVNGGKFSKFWTAVEHLFTASHALGRHVQEGKLPAPAEARFIVHSACALIELISDLDDPKAAP